MKLSKKHIATIVGALSLCACSALQAADNGYYTGFTIGQTRANFDTFPGIAGGLPVTYDNSAGAWKVYGGYQFNKYFGAELSYFRLGSYLVNVAVPGVGNLFTNTEMVGFGASLVGTFPLRRDLSLLARIGDSRVRQTRGNCTVCVTTVSSASDNTWSLTYGGGIKYDFNPNLSARAEVERYSNVGDSSGNTFGASITVYSVGLGYKF